MDKVVGSFFRNALQHVDVTLTAGVLSKNDRRYIPVVVAGDSCSKNVEHAQAQKGDLLLLLLLTIIIIIIIIVVIIMAVHRGEMQSAQQTKKESNDSNTEAMKRNEVAQKELVLEHLPPLPLVFTILFCSGALLIFALRDFLTTGRNIGGTWDEAMLVS